MKSLIEIKNLSRAYTLKKSFFQFRPKKIRVLNNLSVKIPFNSSFCILGEPGSGKTTLAKYITNFMFSNDCHVRFQNKDIFKYSNKELNKIQNKINLLNKDTLKTYGNSEITVYDNLKSILTFNLFKTDNSDCAIKNLFFTFNISNRIKFLKYNDLNNFLKIKIEIIKFILKETKLIIFDDILQYLDSTERLDLLKIIQNIKINFGISILFISSKLYEIKYYCDYIAIMYLGNIIEFGRPHNIIFNSKHPYTKLFINLKDNQYLPKRIYKKTTNVGSRFYPSYWKY